MLIHIKPKNQPKQTVKLDEANRMLSRGELDGDEPAWTAGLDGWTILRKIHGVKLPEPPPLPHSIETPPIPPDATSGLLPLAPSKGNLQSQVKEREKKLKGVGGWLLLFCIGLVILGPLTSFGRMILYWELSKPFFQLFPTLKTAVIIENFGIAAIVFVGFVIGIGIWRGDRDGKKMAQIYLISRIIWFILIEFFSIIFLINVPPEIFDNVIESALKGIFTESIYFIIWWFYFEKSKRVMNTYDTLSLKSSL